MNDAKTILSTLLILGSVSCGSESSPLETGGTTGTGTTTASTGTGNSSGAGGEGGTATASDCEDYCDQIEQFCTGDNEMYANDGTCIDVCRELPAGRDGDTNSNSLACRAFYLASAGDSPDDNCRYAGPGTEGKCGGSCENFCYLAQKVCTGEQAQWPNQAACIQDCNDFDQNPGEYVAGATGDNFECRLFELTQAANNALNHCRNIGRDSETCIDEGTGGNGPGPGPGPGGGGGNGGDGGAGGDGTGGLGGGVSSSSASSSASSSDSSSSASTTGSGGAGGAGGGG